MIKDKIEELAEEAAHDAVYHIQQQLGVNDGLFASLYFSGDRWDALISILGDYISAEIMEGKQ